MRETGTRETSLRQTSLHQTKVPTRRPAANGAAAQSAVLSTVQGTARSGAEDPGEVPARIFETVRKLVYEKAGIELRPGKESLVSARLRGRMRETGCRSYEAYLEQAMADPGGEGVVDLIDALTTNFTSFLREPAHFEFFRKRILPSLASRPRLEIWCAAAATGEEPYSIAFTMLDVLGTGAAAQARVLATDISTRALGRARRGVYPQERLTAVPREWISQYMMPGSGDSQGQYKVQPAVARMVQFERLNLIEPTPARNRFPLIWCRNVMIYFDRPTQERVVERLAQSLEPGGYLFVGHAESLSGIRHTLEFVQPAVYRRPD